MTIQSRTALVAAMTFSLAAGTSLLAGSAFAQSTSPGSPGGAAATGQGTPTPGGAAGRSVTTDQPGATDRGGVSDPMRRGGGASSGNMPMSGTSGTDATRPGTMRDRTTTTGDGALVGNEKLGAALSAIDGESAANRRRGGTARTARLVQIEEYETAMRNANALTDPAARANAVAEARARLQGPSGQAASPEAIARVDSILGLPTTTR